MIGVLPPQGGTIKLLVDLLNINKAEDEQKTLLEELTDSVIAVEHRLPTIHVTFFCPGRDAGNRDHPWTERAFLATEQLQQPGREVIWW